MEMEEITLWLLQNYRGCGTHRKGRKSKQNKTSTHPKELQLSYMGSGSSVIQCKIETFYSLLDHRAL
jgi:hypothetical protein